MVKLFCAIVGPQGSTFKVKIDESESVRDLKKAIVENKPNALKGVGADLLQLFLAKKDKGKGAWLTEEDVVTVRYDLVSQNYKAMKSTLRLEHDEIFGEGFQPDDDQVHVLVVVPKGAEGSVSEASRMDKLIEMVIELNDKVGKTLLGKRKICHSSASWSLLDDLHLRVRASRAIHFKTENHVEPFKWGYIVDERGQTIKLTEEQNRERYREYVEVNIGDALKKNKLCVYSVEKGEGGEDILSANVPGHNMKLVGRTDLIILSDQVLMNPHELKMFPDVKLIIEVKEEVVLHSMCQTVSELVALDIMAVKPVMALLTDFKKYWDFFWVSDPTKNEGIIESVTIRDPSEAFAVIRTVVNQSPSADAGANIALPCFQEPIKRQKIYGVLASFGEGGGTSIRESIEQYNDIASILGPDIEMARAVASQITRSIPTFSDAS